jgi:hypothetical protein
LRRWDPWIVAKADSDEIDRTPFATALHSLPIGGDWGLTGKALNDKSGHDMGCRAKTSAETQT